MEKQIAEKITQHGLKAIEELNKILYLNGIDSIDNYQILKKGIGLAIGKIETDVLYEIFKLYPELDNLKN